MTTAPSVTDQAMTLVGFLLARVAEDEESARPRTDGRKRRESGGWSRARRLAECAARRQIVEECADCTSRPDDDPTCDGLAHFVLRLLALPYADHPDYRAEWRP